MGKAWKETERKIAKSIGTTRTPLSGGNSGHTRSDTLDDKLFIEVKCRNRFYVLSLYRQTAEMAGKENKIPVLALKENYQRGELAVIDWDFFVKLWECFNGGK